MTADRAALVEKVAEVIRLQRGATWAAVAYDVVAVVEPIIRAETLEEAARVAARMYRKGQIGKDIAAAIRALKEKT